MTAEPPNPFPPTLTCYGDELMALMARSKAREFAIHAITVGKTNAEWVCSVSWPQPELPIYDPN